MSINERFPIWICTDCLFLCANGDIGDNGTPPPNMEPGDAGWHIYNLPRDDQNENPNSRHAALMEREWPSVDGWNIYLGDDEQEFSWSQCDGCGSRLGGSRHEATAMRDTDYDDRPTVTTNDNTGEMT